MFAACLGDAMVATTLPTARARRAGFYVWMAAVCAVVAFGAFLPTYWLQLAGGTFVGGPLVHLHAAVFTAWTLLFLSQTWLAANGGLRHHRDWGLVGVSLATALVLIGSATAIQSGSGRAAIYGDAALAFMIVPLTAIALFAGFFTAAVANLRRPEVHKRLMLLATISLLNAAVARIFFVLKTGGGAGLRPGLGPPTPMTATIAPALLMDLLVLAAILYDWRARGRPHPAYLAGAAIFLAVQLLRIPLSQTTQWLAFAKGLTAFAG